jgi:Family of unknown function (DUF5946)
MPAKNDPNCSSCGLAVPGGAPACRAIFDDLCAREWNNPTSYRYHRMFVDSYSLQHPVEFCTSAKSFAAHLTGLCAAFEHKSHSSVLKSVNRWLSGNPSITKPELPTFRGTLTIAELQAAVQAQVQAAAHHEAQVRNELHTEAQAEPNPFPLAQAIDRWARSTWQAYSVLHPLARLWITQSFSAK